MLRSGTGKSKSTNDVPNEMKVKKSKSFKRIRGFLSGESRKERRARKAAAKAAAASQAEGEAGNDELSTVFNVDVDDRSVATTGNSNNVNATTAESFLATAPKSETDKSKQQHAYILKVVLLLMDPQTRRFELLQLEFDSLKALVSDVLAQIPVSVTEEALRIQHYTGIAGKDGVEMAPSKLLATFCSGNEVLVAVPDGVAPKECARLARPILNDQKVVNMLTSSGIDASGWKEDPNKKKKKSALKSVPRSAEPDVVAEPLDVKKSRSGSKLFSVVFIVIMAIFLNMAHVYLSASIKPGNTVKPNTWLSKCGLLTVLPSCENAYLIFDKDGTLKHYNSARQLTWQIVGETCNVEDTECVPGLHFQSDRKIFIGGKRAKSVDSFVSKPKFTPWPFEAVPEVQVNERKRA